MNTSSSPLVVDMRGVTKRFGDRTVLDDVELRVPRGCAFGFLGPNGAGKTTLIRVLLGLLPVSAGEMTLLGHPLPAERSLALARVGAIVEEPRFHPHLTGRENLAAAAAPRGIEAEGRIDAVIARVGLAGRAGDRVGSYSMGMRQRLGIARCLLVDPELLILDEPMNGLDPAGILEMRGLIRDFVDEGRTVLLSSHLLDEVERTCDGVAIIDRGRIVTQGTLAEAVGAGDNAILVGSDDPALAAALLTAHPAVIAVSTGADGSIRVTLTEGASAAVINRALVERGIAVHRLEPDRLSLEERFLELTSRLGAA
ncbi:MAG TPA: ABC transporter ATP-binding protein [Candidatus Dormibacteraeota bacterium]|jgi:ABC-2 type transport system ATP-binding protein|nr:ABC transporter ATP-binding protein [Candidatus Dormibacteraeota bacterium]